jgi:hypothetical protein
MIFIVVGTFAGWSGKLLTGTIDILEQDGMVNRWSEILFAGIRNGPEQDGIYMNIVQDINRNHRCPGERLCCRKMVWENSSQES